MGRVVILDIPTPAHTLQSYLCITLLICENVIRWLVSSSSLVPFEVKTRDVRRRRRDLFGFISEVLSNYRYINRRGRAQCIRTSLGNPRSISLGLQVTIIICESTMHSIYANEQYTHFLSYKYTSHHRYGYCRGHRPTRKKTEWTDHARNIWRTTAVSKIYDGAARDRKTCAICLVYCYYSVYYGITIIWRENTCMTRWLPVWT